MKKLNAKKVIIWILSLTAVIAVSYQLLGVFRMLLTESGRLEFREIIMDMGAWGWLALLGLNISQVFLFFFPGEPVELLTGMCYGTVRGLLIIYLGLFISCGIIFYLVRKVGKESVYTLVGKERIDKIENSKFLRTGKAERLLLLLFVIPGTPKDFLVYVGAMMPVNVPRFIILSTLFRFPGIVSSTIVGESFAEGRTILAVILYGITFVVSLILLGYYSKKEGVKDILDLNKTGQEEKQEQNEEPQEH